jgi:hypothetical protein
MSNNLLITGAGVDKTAGIDFPLANTLLADVTKYIANEGKEVDIALREMLPGLRFSFNSMVARAVDSIATREANQQRAMIERVQHVISNLPPEKADVIKHGELLVKLFNKLAKIADESILDEEIEVLIKEVFPAKADEWLDSDSILDIHKLSLSDTFKAILKHTLRMGLSSDNEVAAALGADMLNIETLLIEKFLGFYNEKQSDIKNYIYISWALWAYLVWKQKKVFDENTELPFYNNIPNDYKAITLNYTAFLQKQLGSENTIYFHGGLAEYVRMDIRDLVKVENILQCEPSDFLRNIISQSIDISGDSYKDQKHVIPALVPPLKLKPVLSNEYIRSWGKAANWVEEATKIVVVGYSFNSADEHFNDILRKQNNHDVFIIAPDATTESFTKRIEKVYRVPANQFTPCTVDGKTALQSGRVRLISACADEIDLSVL